jgi:cell division protein FtsB
MLKSLVVVLIAIFLFLQYRLWFEYNGLPDTTQLNKAIATQKKEDDLMLERNKALIAEVKNLKTGNRTIEGRAREELGMIKKDEQFYQIVKPNDQLSATSSNP